jgi:hypothetical protein
MGPIYTPLDSEARQIRVLQLSPAKCEADDIECSLTTISIQRKLRKRKAYEALSYTWGPSEPRSTLRLNGSIFEISPNLNLALRRLRSPSNRRVLWIDAICINQEDVRERTQQVNMMCEVYASASRVLVWLGESDPHIDEALDYIADMETPRNIHKEWEEAEELFSPIVQGLMNLLNKPWWYRIWVVQEVIVTDEEITIGCGHRWLDFNHVIETVREAVILNITSPGDYLPELGVQQTRGIIRFANFVIACRRGWATSLRSPDANAEVLLHIEDVLWFTRGRDATDPRDQVFGILGLIGDTEHGWFSADYLLSTEEVYQKAMIRVFESSKNLCLLVHASKGRTTTSLPSWCLDFSMPSLGVSSQGWNNDAVTERETLNDHAIRFVHEPQSGNLTVSGVILGHITSHYNFTRQADAGLDELLDFHQELLMFQKDAVKALVMRLGDEAAADECAKGTLIKTIFAAHAVFDVSTDDSPDPKPTRRLHPAPDDEAPEYASGYALLQDWFSADIDDEPPAEFNWVLQVLQVVYEWWKERALLVTDLGFIGNADEHVEAGDVLCFIWGCSLPAVVRPQPDGRFRLVTFAWVQDISREEKETEELAIPQPAVSDLARVHARMRELTQTSVFEEKDICLY